MYISYKHFTSKNPSDQDSVIFPSVLWLLNHFNLKKKKKVDLLETKALKCEVEMFHVGDLDTSLSFSKVSFLLL